MGRCLKLSIIEYKKIVENYLKAAVKHIGGYASTRGVQYPTDPYISEPHWDRPNDDTILAKEIGRQSGEYPNYTNSPQPVQIPIKFPITNTVTKKTIDGFKWSQSIVKKLQLKFDITAKIPEAKISGYTIGFSPGASISRESNTTEDVYISDSTERTHSTDDTPPATSQTLQCPPNTKLKYTVVYFGGNTPKISTATIRLQGKATITGVDVTAPSQERPISNVIGYLEFNREFDMKPYKMVVTADQLANRIPGYNPPYNVQGNTGAKILTINVTEVSNVYKSFSYEILIHQDPLPGNSVKPQIFIHRPDENDILKASEISFQSEINENLDIVLEYIYDTEE